MLVIFSKLIVKDKVYIVDSSVMESTKGVS